MKRAQHEDYGGWKVWSVPQQSGGIQYQVRRGNTVISRHTGLFDAMTAAKGRMNAWWDEQARFLKEEKLVQKIEGTE